MRTTSRQGRRVGRAWKEAIGAVVGSVKHPRQGRETERAATEESARSVDGEGSCCALKQFINTMEKQPLNAQIRAVVNLGKYNYNNIPFRDRQ